MGLPRVNTEAPRWAFCLAPRTAYARLWLARRAARRAAAEPETSCAWLRLVRAREFCASQVRAVVDASEGRR